VSEQPTTEQPTTEPQPLEVGAVVRFDVVNPYGEQGESVDTYAGVVVDTYADEQGGPRVRVLTLGRVQDSADFPASAVQAH
jgi:hypothetical protein